MPNINGLQLTRICKSLKPVPILLLTGWGILLSPQELNEHGVDRVLAKPVRISDLLNAVDAFRV